MPETMLHVGCGPYVHEGWVNIDKSPSVLLSRLPAVRKLLYRLRILTEEQARGFPRGVIQADVSKRLLAEDASVDFIYSSHMVEHLSRWQCLAFVRECRRVLRPDGVLRLATPDLEILIQDYVSGDSPFLEKNMNRADAFCNEYSAYADPQGSTVRRLVKKLLGGDSHQWLYDFESLSYLLKEGGFSVVDRRKFREGDVPRLEEVENRERGLFVEAR